MAMACSFKTLQIGYCFIEQHQVPNNQKKCEFWDQLDLSFLSEWVRQVRPEATSISCILINQLLVHFIFLDLFQGSGILPGRGKVEPEHHPNSPGASTTTSNQQNSK